jgi:hypothetical protein
MGTLETEVARHIAALIDYGGRVTDNGVVTFSATANGPLIHVTSTTEDRRQDAWVLTVEWDGERDHPANNAPEEAP